MTDKVHVLVRCRPLNSDELKKDPTPCVSTEENAVLVAQEMYSFNRAFGEDSSQIEIYDAAKHIVKDLFRGKGIFTR